MVNTDYDQKKALLVTGTYQLSEVEKNIKARCDRVFEIRWKRMGDRFCVPHSLEMLGLDGLVKARLTALGFTVVEVEDGRATALDARDKAIAVISASVDAAKLKTEFYEAAVPVVALNRALFKRLIKLRASKDKPDGNSSNRIPAENPKAIREAATAPPPGVGLAQSFLGQAATEEFIESGAINIIAQMKISKSPMVSFGYESGVEVRGRKLPAKRAGFFSEDGSLASTTSVNWLPSFDATIYWAEGVQALRRFDEVFREEWQEIHRRRLSYGAETEFDGRHAPRNLAGLALSGGGIRSATFSLGLLQGLHELKLLHLFDYLSTVSGGGYVGGWWSAWLSRDERETEKGEIPRKREEPGQAEEPERARELKEAATVEAQPGGREPNIFPPSEVIELGRHYQQESRVAEGSKWAGIDPIHHLRLFANYLTPRKGALSGDTWRAVSIVMRNLVLTWLVLIPMLIAVVLVGKLYFVLQPMAVMNYLHADYTDVPRLLIRLELMAQPLIFLIGWIIVMSFFWLICSKDRPSALDVILLSVSLVALLALGGCGLYLFDSWMRSMPGVGHYSLSQLLVGLGFWLLGAAILVGYALWPVPVDDIADQAEKQQWRMEVRRSRSSQVQSKLMVVLAVTTVVLGFSGFGHIAVEYVHNSDWQAPRVGGLLTIFATIAGSIFTAYRATPSGGGDKRDAGEPSYISRFVFALTPPLVVILLALGVAWGVHHLLGYILHFILPTSNELIGLSSPFAVATLFSLFLCAVLALHEMKWRKISSSATRLVVICLIVLPITFSAYYTVGIIGRLKVSRSWAIVLLLFLSLLGVVILSRFEVAEKILGFINGNLRLSKLRKKFADWRSDRVLVWQELMRARAQAALALAIIIIASLLYVYRSQLVSILSEVKTGVLWWNLWPLVIAILAGSLILFRLAVRESSEQSRAQGNLFPFKPAIFKDMAEGREIGALWLLGCLSIVLPIAVSSWLHVLTKHRGALYENLPLIGLPLIVAGLGLSILLFRAAVIEIKKEDEPTPGLTFRLLSRMKWGAGRERKLVKSLAAICLLLAVILGWKTQQLVLDSLPEAMLAFQYVQEATAKYPASPAPTALAAQQPELFKYLAWWWHVARQLDERQPELTKHVIWWLALITLLFVSLNLFRVTVIEMKGGSDRRRRALEWRIFKTEWVRTRHRQKIFTLLALTCIALAGWLGGLLSIVSKQHFNEARGGLFPTFPLAAIVPCFIFTLFEMSWGEGDNRRSLWLLFSAYLVAALLTIIYFLPTGLNDHVLLRIIIALLAIELAWVLALGWTVDPNAVSMHRFYKSRLVRAYLGASNEKRREAKMEITDAVAGDDLLLQNMMGCRRGGPYHLINTTLNLVAGRDLTTAQRSAAAFVLSQRSCGSSRTGYRRTSEYMDGRLSLGTAIAASGAAVSPSMGSMKPTAALAMLMTILNVRLGFWAPTPDHLAWMESQARLWPFYLLREFLSQTNDLSTYCYLTDGGHFDNTGLYALVERGCRFIVLADCGADPEPCFEDLGTAIRRCRIDFGTEIDLDLHPFMRNRKKQVSQHFIVGTINYSKEHTERLGWKTEKQRGREGKDARKGILVVFKPVLVGNETADVRQYAIENSDFPQQTTAKQWFDEAQFESYRRLGQFCAQSAFAKLDKVEEIKHRAVNKGMPTLSDIETIFTELISSAIVPVHPASEERGEL